MRAAFALLPSAVVLVAILRLRASGVVAALASAAATLAVWGLGIYEPATLPQLARAAADAGVLTALVAAMVVPGIVFVEATRERQAPAAIAALVDAIEVRKPLAAILIAVGIGVTVESLTGMGVSLLVTVPLLLRLVDRRQAIGLALVGMSLMPFGALAISAHVGAKLAGLPIEELARAAVRTSGVVAFFLPLLCLWFVPQRRPVDVAAATLAGVVLVTTIAAANELAGVEVAGVAGGLAVMALVAAFATGRRELATALRAPGLVPYGALILFVAAQKLAIAPMTAAGLSPVLATDRVRFVALTSPGVALALATLATCARTLNGRLLHGVARRAWRPLAALALFMLSARLLVECGAIASLAGLLGGLGRAGGTVAVALLGAVGGFVTGSGVTGNALFMPSAAAVGRAFGDVALFAALQNGASGHVGMASLPVLAILIAALPRYDPADEAMAMRIALALAAFHVAVLVLAVFVALAIGG